MTSTAVFQYQPILQQASQDKGVPLNILEGIVDKESGGNAGAISGVNPNGSRDYGLMQVSSSNFQAYGLTPTTAMDPTANINAGADILAKDYSQTGDWSKALSMYNTGSPNSTVGANYATDVLNRANTTYAGAGGVTGATGTPGASGVAGYAFDPVTGTYSTPLTPAEVAANGGLDASGQGNGIVSPAQGTPATGSALTRWLGSYLPTGAGVAVVVLGVGIVFLGIIGGVLGQHPATVLASGARRLVPG